MQERNLQLTRDNLINFLDFVSEKGLMKRPTAVAYKKACKTILGIMDETEAADLSKINIETIINRHRNLATGKISPATLRAYESRVRAAVKDFFEYVKNPSSWKPGVVERTRRGEVVAPSAKKSKELEEKTLSQPAVHIDFQIHISPESTPEQIDKIFESMSRHFGKRTD